MLTNQTDLGDDVVVDAFGNVTMGSGIKLAAFSCVVVPAQVRQRLPILGETAFPYSTARPATQADIDAVQRSIGTSKQFVAALVNGLVPAILRAVVDYAEIDGGRGHLT